MLYDALRPALIAVQSLDELCELVDILKHEARSSYCGMTGRFVASTVFATALRALRCQRTALPVTLLSLSARLARRERCCYILSFVVMPA